MVDYQSHYRVYALGLTPRPHRVGVKTLRELYHENGRKVFRERHDRPVHDCRHEVMKDHSETGEFETWLLSHGLLETYRDVGGLHTKTKQLTASSQKPGMLLYKLGKYGSAVGDFKYPRGICTTMSGDILVADTKNNRIQHFTKFGVFIEQFGSFGELKGEFNEPCDVVELTDGAIAVADSRNRRVQVFTDRFVYTHYIPVPGPGLPYSLGCSREMNVAVATTDKKVYIFNEYEKELKHCFSVGSKAKSGSCPVQISMTYDSEILLGDPEDNHIYRYSLDGQLLSRFRPETCTPGLSMSVGGVSATPHGQILVVDTLNHVINLYTKMGDFSKPVLTPTDDAGTIHALALGPEGHLVVTEFSIGGEHCIKIFRYHHCPCHKWTTPPTKITPVASPEM